MYPLMLDDEAPAMGLSDELGRNRGVAVADFDNDGFNDLYLANPGDPARLYMGSATGYREHPWPPTTGWDAGPATADYDGDADLFIACGGMATTCANRLFRNDGIRDGNVVFTDVSAEMGLPLDPTGGFGADWADYDGDGDLDLYVSLKDPTLLADDDLPADPHRPVTDMNAATANRLFRNDGWRFYDVAQAAGVADPRNSHGAVWLDYDLDLDPDLFVPNLHDRNALYRNQGDGHFTEVTPTGLERPTAAFSATVADFDNNGTPDLLVASAWTPLFGGILEEHGLWLSIDGVLVESSEAWGVRHANHPHPDHTMGLVAGDLNGDGWQELIFGNGAPFEETSEYYTNKLLSFNDSGYVRDLTGAIDQEPAWDDHYPYRTHGIAMLDLNHDGRADLFLGNGGVGQEQREPNRAFINHTACTNRQIEVELQGTRSSRDGVGARIRVRDASQTWEIWEIQSLDSGFNSSRQALRTLGLGTHEGPYEVWVQWPSGAIQSQTAVVSGDRVVFEEP